MNAPRWFEEVMREGLGRALLLNLDFRPPEDTAAEVFDQWIDDLWPARKWTAADRERIAEAFRRMRIGAVAWPKPAQFLAVVDRIERPKPEVPALPPPAKSGDGNEAAAKCFADVAELLKERHVNRKPDEQGNDHVD